MVLNFIVNIISVILQQPVQLCFPVLFTSTSHNIPSKPLAAFPVVRGINPVATIVINYLREYWLNWKSNQQPAVSKSCVLLTKLRGFGYCTFVIHNRKQVITELSIYELQFVSNKQLNFEVKWSLDMQKLYQKEKFSTKVIMNGLLKLIWVNSYSKYIKSFFHRV